MDGDFQDPPEVLPDLIDAWRDGAEVVIGVRRSRQERRKILARLFPLFYRVLGTLSDYPIPLNAGIFSLMDRKAVDSVIAMRERNRYFPGLRAWVGYRNAIVYYDRQDRAGGRRQALVHKPDQVRDGRDHRLQLQTVAAQLRTVWLLMHCGSAAGTIHVSFTRAVVTASLGVAAAVFFVGGLLLLSMGILGEYVGRVYDEVRNRPLSLISQVHRAQFAAAGWHDGGSWWPTRFNLETTRART